MTKFDILTDFYLACMGALLAGLINPEVLFLGVVGFGVVLAMLPKFPVHETQRRA